MKTLSLLLVFVLLCTPFYAFSEPPPSVEKKETTTFKSLVELQQAFPSALVKETTVGEYNAIKTKFKEEGVPVFEYVLPADITTDLEEAKEESEVESEDIPVEQTEVTSVKSPEEEMAQKAEQGESPVPDQENAPQREAEQEEPDEPRQVDEKREVPAEEPPPKLERDSRSGQRKVVKKVRAEYRDVGFFDLGSILSEEDPAIIIFVVVGVFVFVSIIVYTGSFLYDLAMGKEGRYWYEVSLQATQIGTNDEKEGSFYGAKVTTGFIQNRVHVGLAGEIGQLNLNLLGPRSNKKELNGLYGVVGPSIHWDFSSSPIAPYCFMELLGGTSEHDEMGLLGVARIGVDIGLGDHLRLGFNVGSLYSNLKGLKGFVGKNKNYNLLLGLDLGYRF